jgi:hypothetical protein
MVTERKTGKKGGRKEPFETVTVLRAYNSNMDEKHVAD